MVHKVFPAGRLNNPDWSLYDAYFAKVASQNFKGCLLTFGTTAIDAGTDPTYNWGAYTPGDESYYANLSVFRDVVVSPMVARAGGLVTDIEPVNENALHAPFSPLVQANTQQRIAHYAAARAGAKAVDPKINCLGLTQTNSGWRPGDTTYDFISGGGGAYLDDLAIHTYAGAGTVMANLIKLLNSLSGTRRESDQDLFDRVRYYVSQRHAIYRPPFCRGGHSCRARIQAVLSVFLRRPYLWKKGRH